MEGLEAEGGWRAGPERPLTILNSSGLNSSGLNSSRGMTVLRSHKLAIGSAAPLLAGAVLAGVVLAGCSGGPSPHASKATSSSVTQTTKPSTSSLYNWQRDQGASLDIGGGSTSSLSSVVAPAVGGDWLIAGTQYGADGSSLATVWTSPDAARWTKTTLAPPPGAGRTAADAATNWGSRQVVVGSAGAGDAMRAAVWVSARAGQVFQPVTDSAAFEPLAPASEPGQGGAVMDAVTAGALGLFASGTMDGKATVWFSTDARHWQVLSGADNVIDQASGAVVNAVLATPAGVFAGGSYTSGTGLSAALWYSSDGIHWTTVRDSVTSPFGLGDQVITSLAGIGGPTSSGPGMPAQRGLLAVGGVRTGPAWQPASWISPNGSSWSQTSESFPLDGEPPQSPGALAYAATNTGDNMFAVGGSPGRQRLWQSTGGLAWSNVPLPPAARADPDWHLGLVAADLGTTVLADNIPGQPYVMVRRDGAWAQPSATGIFGRPLPTAIPTSLVDDNGALLLSVELSRPSQALGRGTTSVALLSSSDGRTWRAFSPHAFHNATVNQLLPVPGGLLAVGAAPLPSSEAGAGGAVTGAFASLSANGGATWPTEPISPATLGGPGPAVAQGTSNQGAAVATAQGETTTSAAGVTTNGGASTTSGADVDGQTPVGASLAGPFSATAAGRLGNSEYVVGVAGPEAVGWYSPDGSTWEAPQPLDASPQLASELPLATCWAGASAVVVGSSTSTAPGSMPSAWVSTDGSSWTSASFLTSPPAGSTTTVAGCLSTGNGFIAYGGSTGGGAVEQPALWTSNNGTKWQQLAATFTGPGGGLASGPEVAPLDGIALGTTTWLGLSGHGDLPSEAWPASVGGSASAQVTLAGLWASGSAGDSWQQLDTSVPAFIATIYAQADQAAYVGQDPVVAGTVDGRLAIWFGTPAVATSRS